MPVDGLVTTRHGGVSGGPYASLNLGLHVGDDEQAVLENRRRAARTLGAGLEDLVFAEQVHGNRVAEVDRRHAGRGSRRGEDAIPGADALVTRDGSVVLAVLVADCVPILLFDPRAHVLACVHAGWRGTVAGVVQEAVRALVMLGSRPDDIVAGIGPAVAPERYEVGDEVFDAARDALGHLASRVLRPAEGRWRFDLRAANRSLLEDAGVSRSRIAVADVATGEGTPFYSHRQSRPCGRFALLARLAAG